MKLASHGYQLEFVWATRYRYVLLLVLLSLATGSLPAYGQTDVDVSVTKGNTPDQVAFPGDVTTYTVELTNNSITVAADDLVLEDVLPVDHLGNAVFGEPFNVMNTHGTYSFNAGTDKITISDVDLAPGETMTLMYSLVVVTPFEGDYTNTASVVFPPAWVYDSNQANNTVSYLLTVLEPLKYPAKTSVQSLVACQNAAGDYHIIAGQMNGPILRSVPDGYFLGNRRWSFSTVGLPVENLVVNDLFVAPDGAVFAAVWGYDGLYRTDDCARTWTTVDFPGMAQYNDPFKIVYAITRGPGGPLGYILYASADRGRIFRSLDGGITWDMTMSLPGGSADTPWALAADPTTDGLLFAGTFGNGIYVSRDYGEFWERAANNGIPHQGAMHIFDLEFDPEKMPMTLWAATAEGVFFTQDEGYSWAEQSGGLEITGNNGNTFVTKEARAITFAEPNDASPIHDYTLFTSVWGAGIFSLDGDRYYHDWSPVLLKNMNANAILVHGGKLFVGTDGQGVEEVQLSTTSTANENEFVGELPNGFSLEQNYPNPFNPATSISFDLPEAAAVRLAVYDVLGREIAVLVDGNLAAGNHAVNFNAVGLQSGMYIYRLESGANVLANSMVLMK